MSLFNHKCLSVQVSFCLYLLWATPAFTQTESVTQLSFGRILPDQKIEQVIKFDNPTGTDLKILNIQLSPPLVARGITETTPPNGTVQFTLVLGKERDPGDYRGLVKINFEGNVLDPVLFAVEGYIIPPIEFNPKPAFFVATHAGTEKTASIEIINHRNQLLELVGTESDSERFSTRLETIERGQHYRLSLILDGTAKPGKESTEIILLSDPPMQTPLLVQANTIIREAVYTFPQAVNLGNLPNKVATDSSASNALGQTLMVYRPGTTDFEIEATVNLNFIKLESERGPDGDRYQLTLTLIPEKVVAGKIEGTVLIKTNDDRFSTLEIPVSGHILD